jgi:hypothetical protein
MEWDDFCAPAYKLETTNAGSSVMRNLYLEQVEKGPRAGKFRIRATPGLNLFATLPDLPVRALLRIDGGNRLFAVGGQTVFEVFRNGTFQALTGSIASSAGPAIMVSNGFQLAIASGGFAYLVEGGNPVGTVTPIVYSTDGTPVRAASIDFLKQFFVAALVDSKQITSSNVAPNGGAWDGEAAIKEGYPDNIARVYADNQILWLFGFDTIEPFVGNPAVGGFPFASQDVVLKFGCSAPFSVAGANGARFWLWNGAVYGAEGMNPERISDDGVEEAIGSYAYTADAEGFCQVDGRHVFYFLSFPTADRTWVYDMATKSWHERLYFSGGRYGRFRGRVYANAFGKHLVGDYQTGQIFEMTSQSYTDNGQMVRRQRICPYLTDEMRNIRHNRLTIDMDTGVGLPLPDGFPGVDPQLILRWSDDRGKTWGNEIQEPMGRLGETFQRVVFNQLGSSRIGRVYDVVITDPVPVSINGAYLQLGGSTQARRG